MDNEKLEQKSISTEEEIQIENSKEHGKSKKNKNKVDTILGVLSVILATILFGIVAIIVWVCFGLLTGETKYGTVTYDAKPVIYIYPEQDTEVKVQLSLKDSELTTLYPEFNSDDAWKVLAHPNGDIEINNKNYNYLYWEAEHQKSNEFTPQYCIKGSETAAFLESKLLELGLTEHESNEFIVYWLPLMQNNTYNLITFDTTEYEKRADLNTIPEADTMIRVFMTFEASDKFVETKEVEIKTPERKGFTVVEWGGSERK